MDRDMETEVVTRLKALNAAGTGLILCTHRPALAEMADRWVVMEAGRIIVDDTRKAVIDRLRKSAAKSTTQKGAAV
jgi:ATP-binding cassette subfamily C protein LapB